MSDFDILTTTRPWVAVPWDFNSCISLCFRPDSSGDMVFARLQITSADIKFRFLLQPPNDLKLIYRTNWRSRENSFPTNESGKAIHYSLTETETIGVTANAGPFKFCWTLSLDQSPFPDEMQLGVAQQPLQYYGHNVNEATTSRTGKLRG